MTRPGVVTALVLAVVALLFFPVENRWVKRHAFDSIDHVISYSMSENFVA